MNIITAQSLSKAYPYTARAGRADGSSYSSLRDVLTRAVHPSEWRGAVRREFHALRDVNFEVEAGERLGVIGRNGAGKSTLLKVLARITPPTSGRAVLRGRVASLLEVGTGFHPELTGRENVYLNAAILGISRAEARAEFESIVSFSGVEAFIDQPLKQYSSGMRLRLAFAVAAHLQPEILLVDEVLAVGDAAFQQKCLNKMSEIGQSGRTMLFVSHDLAAVQQLCRRAIWLEGGTIIADGNTASVVAAYLERFTQHPLQSRTWQPTNESIEVATVAYIEQLRLADDTPIIDTDTAIVVEATAVVVANNAPCLTFSCRLTTGTGTMVFTHFSTPERLAQGKHAIRFTLPRHFRFYPGNTRMPASG